MTWEGGGQLRLDDRKTEQNAYRAALIGLRRARRNHEEFTDIVRADVRRAVRRHDVVFIPPGVEHALYNSGLVDLVFLVVTTPAGDEPV